MSDLPLGLDLKSTYAALSPSDLEGLGKQASIQYCNGDEPSLNDAIIKMARQHPSISPHQVLRVIEFANQDVFDRQFRDNEKYAQDKNIDFAVADPGDILLELNNGAKPQIMSASPDEYSRDPVKLGHDQLQADVLLMEAFGVSVETPGAMKTAAAEQSQPDPDITSLNAVLAGTKLAQSGDLLDRILVSGESPLERVARVKTASEKKKAH